MSDSSTSEQWQRAWELVNAVTQRDELDKKIEKLGFELAANWEGTKDKENDIAFTPWTGPTYVLKYDPDYADKPYVYIITVMKALHA